MPQNLTKVAQVQALASSLEQPTRSQCVVSSHDFVLVVIASFSTLMQQVLISAAVGAASTQKSAIDLWWNTTFLSPDGENINFLWEQAEPFARGRHLFWSFCSSE